MCIRDRDSFNRHCELARLRGAEVIVVENDNIALDLDIPEDYEPVSYTHLKQYYSPKLWVPHITLALNDLNQDNLACAINKIAFEPIELFVRVDNLAIVQHEDDDKEGQSLAEFHLSGD